MAGCRSILRHSWSVSVFTAKVSISIILQQVMRTWWSLWSLCIQSTWSAKLHPASFRAKRTMSISGKSSKISRKIEKSIKMELHRILTLARTKRRRWASMTATQYKIPTQMIWWITALMSSSKRFRNNSIKKVYWLSLPKYLANYIALYQVSS